MRYPILLAAFVVLGLAACNPQAPTPSVTNPSPADSANSDAAKKPIAKKLPRRITAEEIAQIEASGRTGLWSEVTEMCPGAKPVRTTLTWNVKSSGAARVVVYVLAKNGEERNFGQGGAIGLKETGPWLRPGTTFKIRAAGTKQELGSLTISEKQC